MKNKILVVIIFFITLSCFYFFLDKTTSQKTISKNNTNGLIFPKTGNYYLVNMMNKNSPSGFSWYLSNTKDDQFDILSDIPNDSSPFISGSRDIFSPDGSKIIYSKDDNLTIYNIKDKQNKIIKVDSEYKFAPYNPKKLTWQNEHVIGYFCPKEVESSSKYEQSTFNKRWCYVDINSNITKTYTQKLSDESERHETSMNYSQSKCLYNFDNTLCATIKPHIRIYEGHLYYDIVYNNKTSDKVIFRGRVRPDNLYWSNDNFLYIELVSGKGLVKTKI